MQHPIFRYRFPSCCLVCLACAVVVGCQTLQTCPDPALSAPRELEKSPLPAYYIEPPDILLIDALRVVPLPPYRIEPLDALVIQASETLPNEPINGIYSVEPDGTVTLGIKYRSVRVAGLTTTEAQAVIEKHLQVFGLKMPKVLVALAQSRGMQQIRGEHLVRPDGTVSLGIYGSVYVTGMTLEMAKAAIEAHLSQYILNPEISIDVYAYNSKVYYLIIDGGGYGEQVFRLPVTGNETVLDAVAQINGLPAVASKKHIWIARPRPAADHREEILPVDWRAIARCGSTATNYQIYPGDRLYVQADSLITLDNTLAKIISPIERVLGVTLLGQTTIRSFERNNNSGNNNNNNNNTFP